MAELPASIAAYFGAEKAGDEHALARCFEENAVVQDEGVRHDGVPAIRSWWRAAKAKYRHVATPVAVHEQDGKVVVRASVTGDFPGSPAEFDFAFKLAGEKIRDLEIH